MEDKKFTDIAAERGCMAGLLQYGHDAFVDFNDLIAIDDLSLSFNRALYRCAEDFYSSNTDRMLDQVSLESVANKLGLASVLLSKDGLSHIRALRNTRMDLKSVRPLAGKIFKLGVARDLDIELREARDNLHRITGDESLNEILALAENPLLDYTAKLGNDDEGVSHIAKDGREWLTHIINNPTESIGIQTPFPIYNRRIGGGYRRKTVNVIAARAKSGKAQPLTAKVYTPGGPVLMGNIKVGDAISCPDGSVTKVSSIHPQGERDVYKVIFLDGDYTECDIDHLWNVKRSYHKKYKTIALRDLIKDLYFKSSCAKTGYGYKWQVEAPKVCQYKHKNIPLDPYLVGYLIGNGSLTKPSPTCSIPDQETVNRLTSLLPEPCIIKHASRYSYIITGNRNNVVAENLKLLRLHGTKSRTKFIPDVYKYNSEDIRWSVLQGWMDADGGVANRASGRLEGSTVSFTLANDLKELVTSLGGICRIKTVVVKTKNRITLAYRLRIRFNDGKKCFRLKRKKDLAVSRQHLIKRTIAKVEYVGKKLTQCIKLESQSGLYMTDNHIVTHNTVLVDNIALHVAGTLNIPVFNLDTEMSREEHLARILASLTGIDSFNIERGKVSGEQAKLLMEKMEWLESIPYYYESVIDAGFEEQIASMRRWVVKNVGNDENGRTKDALILYDYLQFTDKDDKSLEFKEYQILGFRMMSLLRLAKRCDIPILSMLQTNRSGIDKTTTDTAAGSDRIIWKCANFSVIQRKQFDEINMDGPDEGNTKLFTVIARHGPQVNPEDYINMQFDGEYSKFTEKRTRDEVYKDRGTGKQKGFVCEYDPQESFDTIQQSGGSKHSVRSGVLPTGRTSRQSKRKTKT